VRKLCVQRNDVCERRGEVRALQIGVQRREGREGRDDR
jgi:hypothetical protein